MSVNPAINKEYLVFEDTRQKIMLLLRNGRVMTVAQIKKLFFEDALKSYSINPIDKRKLIVRTYGAIHHHVKLLRLAGLIQQVEFNDKKGKYKGYKITETGSKIIDAIAGLRKQSSISISLTPEGGLNG